ncbi:group I truncated hemoglobin [Embleya hyalina]|uniref:Hemin receptor n=1 Tax=Embleya hyalina TaxID=516124 RepID=A0A401YX50_9ACTN|nr:group 1 truncated hemoglobin [Embleya hyalina]GCD99105.1 hemin receptor [Embleya hyalina]
MSIYESIGGESVLVEVLDRLYRRIELDPDLARFFANSDLGRLEQRQAEFLGQALGGPVEYRGRVMWRGQAHGSAVQFRSRSMKDVHGFRGFRIEQRHFDKFVEHLAASLTAAGVPDDITEEILAVVAPLADEIVSGPPEWDDGGALTGF